MSEDLYSPGRERIEKACQCKAGAVEFRVANLSSQTLSPPETGKVERVMFFEITIEEVEYRKAIYHIHIVERKKIKDKGGARRDRRGERWVWEASTSQRGGGGLAPRMVRRRAVAPAFRMG
jgi:hypothetical protein